MAEKWDQIVRDALANQDRIAQQRRKRELRDSYIRIKALIPLSVLVGMCAFYLMVSIYGWREITKTLLSWIVGATIVTAVIALMQKKGY